jgi:lipoate-protein ligase A
MSFTRPAAPYVCLGYHRGIDEVDGEYCREQQLPVLRRMVGGGPVYLDTHQLFFQICVPASSVPAVRAQALFKLLEPAVAAFCALGVPAVLDEDQEICVGDRKICGHGAGQIEDAVVVCGNLIERFDYERATRVLALADAEQAEQTLALMRRFVAATPVDPVAFQAAVIDAYASALGLEPAPGELTEAECLALVDLDERFSGEAWTKGADRPAPSSVRGPSSNQVKVRAGVFTYAGAFNGARVSASVVKGILQRVRITDAKLNGSTREAERALLGASLQSVPKVLAGFGEAGGRIAAAFAAADPGRI